MYAVYTGGPTYRQGRPPCNHQHPPACADCARAAILMVSLLHLRIDWESTTDTASRVLEFGIPLEDLADPRSANGELWCMPDIADSNLRGFLDHPQDGPRGVARRILQEVLRERNSSFSAPAVEDTTLAGEPVFEDVPEDRGHYPEPYFEHDLRGLRRTAPSYVRDTLDGLPVPADVSDRVGGLVLVHF